MSDKPLLIGITGGIGSGKSTVCKILETLGHQVYYADNRAKWLMANDEHLKKKIQSQFGEEVYKGGSLNREYLAETVFHDKNKLEVLNGLVHPEVGADLRNWVASNNTEKLLFDEAALLFEAGSYKKMDKNILVTAPEQLRIQRVLERDKHRTEKDVRAIIAKQMTDEEKSTLADFIIVNDGSQSIIAQTMQIREDLLAIHHK
ncbi:MAG: dephospho-CoA kinase [Ekhidna sp.]